MEEGFVFERLSRQLNIHKILKLSDGELLDRKNLRLLAEELSNAFISTPEADRELGKAIQLAQYSLQYLRHSCKQIQLKKDSIACFTKTIKEEREALNLQLAKLKAKQKALSRDIQFYDDIENKLYGSLVALDANIARSYVSTRTPQNSQSSQHSTKSTIKSFESVESVRSSSDFDFKLSLINSTKIAIPEPISVPSTSNLTIHKDEKKDAVLLSQITPRQLQLNVEEVLEEVAAMLLDDDDTELSNQLLPELKQPDKEVFEALSPITKPDTSAYQLLNSSLDENEVLELSDQVVESAPIQVPTRKVLELRESASTSQNPFLSTFSAKELFESPPGTASESKSASENNQPLENKTVEEDLTGVAEEKPSYCEQPHCGQSKSECAEEKVSKFDATQSPTYSDDEFDEPTHHPEVK